MRILLSAYACEPDRGSEPGVGWSWASELSRLGHQVCVLTRADNRAAVERRPLPDLDFIYYDLPQWIQLCRRLPGGKSFYYLLWQWGAARYVRGLRLGALFDVVQHITYVSVRYPSFMGTLGIPFYFGPVSGGERVPAALRKGFSARQRWREALRDLSNRLVPLDPLLRSTFRRGEKIIVTRDTLPMIPQRWRRKCDVQLAIGLTHDYLRGARAASRRAGRYLRLLFAGRLLEWKGIDIALHAVKLLRQWDLDVHLTIVGDGPARLVLTRLGQELGLSEVVEWVGCVPQREVEDYYRTADVFVFPSLRDSGGMAVLEAMAHGLPVVCTEIGGPGVIVNWRCGRKLPALTTSREELAVSFAGAICEIMTTAGLRERLARGARARARHYAFQGLIESVYPAAPRETETYIHEYPVQLDALVPHDVAF